MTDTSEQISLEQLCTAITAGITAALPEVKSAEFWPQVGRRLDLPCVLGEVAGLQPGTDPGTGETALVAHIQARIVVDPNALHADMKGALLATRLVRLLQNQNWGLPITLADFSRAAPDWTHPDLDGYLVWLVEWRHEFHIGEIEWPYRDELGLGATSVNDTALYFGYDPETGPGNEHRYTLAQSPDGFEL